jgi:hypothetical protein
MAVLYSPTSEIIDKFIKRFFAAPPSFCVPVARFALFDKGSASGWPFFRDCRAAAGWRPSEESSSDGAREAGGKPAGAQREPENVGR